MLWGQRSREGDTVGREGQAEAFVRAAIRQTELVERSRVMRADLVRGRWWPLPERRALAHEIAQATRSLELVEAVVGDREQAVAVATALIDLAVEETGLARPDGESDPSALVAAVLELLARPGRSPLPAGSQLALPDLPPLAGLLDEASVLRHLTMAPTVG